MSQTRSTVRPEDSVDPEVHSGLTRTIFTCTNCPNQIVALLDYDVNGNHIVQCPSCGHEHCRVIESGRITDIRWSSRYGDDRTRDAIRARRVWKDANNPLCVETSSASEFIRRRWIEKAMR